jgi:glycosyltransferase involved in cell wall biosynthesis
MGVRIHIISMRQPRERFSHASVKQIRAAVDYLPETLLRDCRACWPATFCWPLADRASMPGRWPWPQGGSCAPANRHHQTSAAGRGRGPPDTARSGVTHLHAHFAHSPTSVTLFTSLLSGLPFSFTAHAKDIYTSDRDQLAEKIRLARFVVTCTGYNKAYLEKLAPLKKNAIHRIYHGIDTRLFGNHSDTAVPGPPYHLLTVARLTPEKGTAHRLPGPQTIDG